MKDLEQNIKQQLEERRITPSTNAWDKIALEVQETPTKNRRYIPWLAAASIVLVGALIVKLALNNQTAAINQPEQESNFAIEKTESTTQEIETFNVQNIDNTNVSNQNSNSSLADNRSTVNKKTTTIIAIQEPKIDVEKQNITQDKQIVQVPEKLIQPPSKSEQINANRATLIADNSTLQSVDTLKKKRIKINRDKLLFSVENEEVVNKSKKVAFTDNTLKIDLNN